ncbi:heterokaryon incompatibility protein-domain-containing protein [Cladorrhinum sp. PSN332]|nr:heterokaryon incompatibility protein-domain-containing protein [Cladorrhinum sp. PSN332]
METTTAAKENVESEDFCYAAVPLDESKIEIRLLELLPSSPAEPLICRIFVTTLNDPCKPYTALSHDSLDGPLIIWIDQICINQGDAAEKSHQVGLMGRIYSSAAEVLVWLGPAENNSDAVMDAWRKIGQASRDLGIEAYYTPEKQRHLRRAMENADPEDQFAKEYQIIVRNAALVLSPLVRDMLTWFERPWFYRAWAVQEFCLCPLNFYLSDIANYLPSWVPDWQSGTKPSFYEIKEAVAEHTFAACGSFLDVEPVPSPDPKVLGLEGYIVGRIEAVSPDEAWTIQDSNPVRYLGYLLQVAELIERVVAKYISALNQAFHSYHRRQESCWRVPTGDLYWNDEKTMHRATEEGAGRHFKQFMEYALFTIVCSQEPDDVREKMMEDWGFNEKIRRGEMNYGQSMEYMNGKRPFLTENGYVGMGPADSKEGDIVVVFCGGRIPFLLRPIASEGTQDTVHFDEQRFQFVGEALCDGIMDGEIVTRTESHNFFLV